MNDSDNGDTEKTGENISNRAGASPGRNFHLRVISFFVIILVVGGAAALFLRNSEVTGHATLSPGQETGRNAESPSEAELTSEAMKSILLAEAARQNVSVNESLVEQAANASLAASKLTEQEFIGYLEQNGYTYEQYKQALGEQLAMARLIQQNVDLESVNVSESEVDGFIGEHRTEFEELVQDEQDAATLRAQVRFRLIRDKQEVLVRQYVASLEAR